MAASPVSNTLETPTPWFSRVLASGRQTLLVQGIKTGLAAGLCYWLALHFGMHEGYWAAISAIIVLQSNVGSTVTASRDRFIGTAIGAVLGFLASPWRRHPAVFAATILVALVLCGLLNLRNSSRLAGVTITIVMLVERNGSHWTIALDRVLEVVVGILVALAVSVLVLPRRARQHLRTGLTQEFQAQGQLFESIFLGFRGAMPEDFQLNKEAVESLVRANEQLLRAARNEPASGPASIEGLSLLSEFGRSIFDALLALEFAVRESGDDKYASRLEPELSNLVIGISQSFKHLADCVGYWRFDIRREGLNPENDIAALKAKVLEIRHTSLGFPLNEVLRAYAVQLHLKNIARLLRAARHEALDATGGQDR
jgi:uncharacterized membrane protein YccC